METGAVISIQSITKVFDNEKPLLKDFSLHVPAGQVCALVGPSGAGKSTLLRLLAGIDSGFEGHIDIDGVPARKATHIGYVFQDPRLLPWETAIENIRAVNPTISVEQAKNLLGEFGLEGYEQAYPHTLSGGMKRRVALARCMSLKPRLILLDEPFVSLDQKLVAELSHLITRIIDKTKATAVLVTHDLHDVERIASRLVRVEGRPLKIVQDSLLVNIDNYNEGNTE